MQASPDDIKNLRDTFQALDKDGDGSITIDELQRGFGHVENSKTLLQLLKGADTDNSGSIDYTEFLAATIDAKTFMKQDYLRTAFNMFDKDGSGKIDKDELVELLQGEDFTNMVPQEELKIYLKEVDANGDGEIDFEEFVEMMGKCKPI